MNATPTCLLPRRRVITISMTNAVVGGAQNSVGDQKRVNVPIDTAAININIVIDNFHKQHFLDYGYTFGSDQVEIMTLRVVGVATVDPMTWPRLKKVPSGKLGKRT